MTLVGKNLLQTVTPRACVCAALSMHPHHGQVLHEWECEQTQLRRNVGIIALCVWGVQS